MDRPSTGRRVLNGVVLVVWMAAMFVVVWIAGFLIVSKLSPCVNAADRVCEPWFALAWGFVLALVLGPAAGIVMRSLTRGKPR